jgi:hypothetical protein
LIRTPIRKTANSPSISAQSRSLRKPAITTPVSL